MTAHESQAQSNPLDNKATRTKIALAAGGRLMLDPVLADASAPVIACASAALHTILRDADLASNGASVEASEIVTELVGRGVDATTARSALSYLARRGVLVIDGEMASIPHLHSEIEIALEAFEVRRLAWVKRAAKSQSKSVAKKQTAKTSKATQPTERPTEDAAQVPSTEQTVVTQSEPLVAASLAATPVPEVAAAPVAAVPAASPEPLPEVTTEPAAATVPAEELVLERQASHGDLATEPAAKAERRNPRQLASLGALESDAVAIYILADDGQAFEVMESYIESVKAAYPRIDVKEQLLRAGAWCAANPTKRKTPRGIPRFINSWLNAAQRDAEMRQVVASAAPKAVRNGFGMGHTSAMQAPVTAAPAQAAGSEADEFADLEAIGGSDESFEVLPLEPHSAAATTGSMPAAADSAILTEDDAAFDSMLSELEAEVGSPVVAPSDEIDAFISQAAGKPAPELDDLNDGFDGGFDAGFDEMSAYQKHPAGAYMRGFTLRSPGQALSH